MKTLIDLALRLAVVFMLIAVVFLSPALAQELGGDPFEVGAGDLVIALATAVTYGVTYLLRRFVFPKIDGIKFLAIVVALVNPLLSFVVTVVSNAYIAPGNSWLKSLAFGLLAVVIKTAQSEWMKFSTKTPEGMLRGAS